MEINQISQYGTALLEHYVLLIALAFVILAVFIFIWRNDIRLAWLNIKTRYRLNHLGLREIADFRFPDGLGNYFSIDRLVMRHDGISLLVFKQYPGSIFCADDINEWTQMLAGKSYRFKNPLIELDYQIKAISASIPGVPVNGFLFFDHRARFPKGHPERVIRFDDIPDDLKRDKQEKVQASVEAAWDKLLKLGAG